MIRQRALITGVTGQDGSYLADFLLAKGYHVCGMVRRHTTGYSGNIAHLAGRLELLVGDLSDTSSLRSVLEKAAPDEVYNLGAQTFVKSSWDMAEMTADITGLGALRLLDAVATFPAAKFYQASSSEMFGLAGESPQNEHTPFHPRSPYATAKVFAHNSTINYREAYGLFACCGILFNHESPRRGREFVTRKVARAAAEIRLGLAERLYLGELHARRDWGFAGDYVEAMWLLLQQSSPSDYVIGSGISHSVEELAATAFAYVGLDWRDFVSHDPALLRPAEVPALRADVSRAQAELGWRPRVGFTELVEMMIDAEMEVLRMETGRSLDSEPLKAGNSLNSSGEQAGVFHVNQ